MQTDGWARTDRRIKIKFRIVSSPHKYKTVKLTFFKIFSQSFLAFCSFAFMQSCAFLRMKFTSGNKKESQKYRDLWSSFRKAVDSIFYNSTMGAWYDFNIRNMKHNVDFYPTMAAPLFSGCYHTLDQQKSERIFKLMNVNLMDLNTFETHERLYETCLCWIFFCHSAVLKKT